MVRGDYDHLDCYEDRFNCLVPYFGGRFSLFLDKQRKSFFATVRSLFHKKSSSHFYIRLCVKILD